MWAKHYRLFLISNIYARLYWLDFFKGEKEEESAEVPWIKIYENTLSVESYSSKEIAEILRGLEKDKIEKDLDFFNVNFDKFVAYLQSLTTNFNKTSNVSKSIIFTYLLETNYINQNLHSQAFLDLDITIEEQLKKLINVYLKICSSYEEKAISNTVHAILLQINAKNDFFLD